MPGTPKLGGWWGQDANLGNLTAESTYGRRRDTHWLPWPGCWGILSAMVQQAGSCVKVSGCHCFYSEGREQQGRRWWVAGAPEPLP